MSLYSLEAITAFIYRDPEIPGAFLYLCAIALKGAVGIGYIPLAFQNQCYSISYSQNRPPQALFLCIAGGKAEC